MNLLRAAKTIAALALAVDAVVSVVRRVRRPKEPTTFNETPPS